MNGLPPEAQIVQRAREIVESASRPSDQEIAQLLTLLHGAGSHGPPEAGRLDVAMALSRALDALPPESQLLVFLVLHDWDATVALLERRPETRAVFFHYLCFEHPALRRWMLRHLDRRFCRDDTERLLYDAARADFPALRGWAADEGLHPLLTSVLREILYSPSWSLFHKDQASRLLQALGEKAPPVARTYHRKPRGRGGPVLQPPPEDDDPEDLAPLLQSLRSRGVLIDGTRVFPRIGVGSVTGRIVYSDPPLQTWTREERERRIQPTPGRTVLMLDYAQLEPTILLNVLVHRLWLAIPDLPTDDVYLWFSPEDRELGKRIVNALINGGSPAIVDPHPKALRFIRAMQAFRAEWVAECRQRGCVLTLAGRTIPLPEGPNAEGKMVNRLVQGSAADLFHAAVVEIYRGCTQEGWPGSILFLLFDEVWVETPEEACREMAERCLHLMRETARLFCPYRAPDVHLRVRR